MWPDYHRGDEEDRRDRRVAVSLAPLIMIQWRRDYAHQVPELRKTQPPPGQDD